MELDDTRTLLETRRGPLSCKVGWVQAFQVSLLVAMIVETGVIESQVRTFSSALEASVKVSFAHNVSSQVSAANKREHQKIHASRASSQAHKAS